MEAISWPAPLKREALQQAKMLGNEDRENHNQDYTYAREALSSECDLDLAIILFLS